MAAAWTNQTTFGSEGSGPRQFQSPSGLAITPGGLAAWVADANNNRITVWTRPGATSTDWANQTTFGTMGSGPSQFDYPAGPAVAPDGLTVWAADADNNCISVWSQGCSA